MLFDSFIEVLDWRPAFEVIGLACNVGLPEKPMRVAATVIVRPAAYSVIPAEARSSPPRPGPRCKATTYEEAVRLNDGMGAPQWSMLRRIAEVDAAIAPYWQRTVYEVHPELSFYQLNDDTPLRYGKHLHRGVAERRALLERRVPGLDETSSTAEFGAPAAITSSMPPPACGPPAASPAEPSTGCPRIPSGTTSGSVWRSCASGRRRRPGAARARRRLVRRHRCAGDV